MKRGKLFLTGQAIKAFRDIKGLQQQELAATLGIGVATLSRWERNQKKPTGTAASVLAAMIAKTCESYPELLKVLEESNAELNKSFTAKDVAVGLAAGAVVGLAGYALYQLMKEIFETDSETEKE